MSRVIPFSPSELPPQARKLAEMLGRGLQCKEIAGLLQSKNGEPVSLGTVKICANRLYHRVGVKNRGEFLSWYFRTIERRDCGTCLLRNIHDPAGVLEAELEEETRI